MGNSMKHKISATVVCKYSGIPLAISTLWPKLRQESKDVMIGQPFSVIASHAKAWRHYNISQKRVIIASLLYTSELVEFKTAINPCEEICDVLIPSMLSVIGELDAISLEKRNKFPRLTISNFNSDLSLAVSWIDSLKSSIKSYKTSSAAQIKLDDIARAMVYNREFEKQFNITTVSKRSFILCRPHLDGMLTDYQERLFSKLIGMIGGTLKQVTKQLESDNIHAEHLKTLRDVLYDCVPEKEARLIPHKILCIRWIDFILNDYNDLLASLSGGEVFTTAQLVGGVVLKTTTVIESDKPKVTDFKTFPEYFKALTEWKKKND